MTEDERELLFTIKNSCDVLAESCKRANDLGYMVNFSINPIAGVVDHFSVTQAIGIDIDSISRKMS